MNAHTPKLRSNNYCNTTGRNVELLLSKEDICLLNPINLYTYTDRTTGNQSCPNICPTTSLTPPSGRKTPWWTGECRECVKARRKSRKLQFWRGGPPVLT